MNKLILCAIVMFACACDIDPLLHRPKLTAATPEQSVCKAACQQSFLSCYEDAAVRCKYRHQGNCGSMQISPSRKLPFDANIAIKETAPILQGRFVGQ